jgi:hypothetical protein
VLSSGEGTAQGSFGSEDRLGVMLLPDAMPRNLSTGRHLLGKTKYFPQCSLFRKVLRSGSNRMRVVDVDADSRPGVGETSRRVSFPKVHNCDQDE